jgi:hyperosmotically inducible protein
MKSLRALAFACAALAAAAPAAAQISDSDLAERVAAVLRAYPDFTVFDDVTITVDHRNVTVTGAVTAPFKRDAVSARIAKIDGIRTFTDNIRVLPVDMRDDELRQQIARAIYYNTTFRKYASMPWPPIHIIVERGRVTLTGVVNSETERMLAYALAQVPGALSVKNELRLDKN